jgi:copper chaperone CopZ
MSQVVTDARKVEGVTSVDPDRVAARITVRYDPSRTNEAAVVSAVQALIDRVAQ